jgi:antitoxin Phd
MQVNIKNLVSITDANQNFSKVARMADENGAAVILKNNTPRYVLIPFSQFQNEESAKDEDVNLIGKKLVSQYRKAFEVLAK